MHDKQLGVKPQMTQMNADSQRGRRPIGGELLSKAITDARGSVTRFGYDLRNRRISKTYPDGSAETWGHDAVGNPVSRRTPSGKVAASLYDNRNRLVSTDWRADRDRASISKTEHPDRDRASVEKPKQSRG